MSSTAQAISIVNDPMIAAGLHPQKGLQMRLCGCRICHLSLRTIIPLSRRAIFDGTAKDIVAAIIH